MTQRKHYKSTKTTRNQAQISSPLFKLLERILDTRFKKIFTACTEQAGFTKGKGTIDQLIRLQEIITYLNEEKGPWLAFIDIQEAFERVWHTGLFYRLWKAGIKGKAWRVTKDMYTDMNAFVRTNHGDTEHFPIKIGVLQGSVLSAILFLIFIDPLILALRPYGTDIAGKKIASLMFADDLDLIADTQEKREKQTTITVKFLRDWRAIMNSPKSRYLFPLKTKQKNEHGIEETDEVTNLGVEVTTKEVFTTKHALKKTQNSIASMRCITNKLALKAGPKENSSESGIRNRTYKPRIPPSYYTRQCTAKIH
jgi:hypothetical protein